MVDSQFIAASPEDVGIDSEKLDALLSRARKEVDDGLLPACQVAIARHGKIAALASFGSATDESLFNVFSSTKAITSAAGWLVMQDGKLRMDERVSDIVPEFGTTVRTRSPSNSCSRTPPAFRTHRSAPPNGSTTNAGWSVSPSGR